MIFRKEDGTLGSDEMEKEYDSYKSGFIFGASCKHLSELEEQPANRQEWELGRLDGGKAFSDAMEAAWDRLSRRDVQREEDRKKNGQAVQ